jgi:hypothetical protein
VKYKVERASGDVIYIPIFIRMGTSLQKFLRGKHTHQGDLISLIVYYRNKENILTK